VRQRQHLAAADTEGSTLRFARMMAAALLVVATPAGGLAVATTSAGAETTCPPDTWPAAVEGRPALDPGVRVWHDDAGWHVRVTDGTPSARTFAGAIHTYGTITDVSGFRHALTSVSQQTSRCSPER
jgi:hypothetical protein